MRLKIRFTKWIIDNTVIIQKSTFKRNKFSACQLPVFFSIFAFSCQWISQNSFQLPPPPPKKKTINMEPHNPPFEKRKIMFQTCIFVLHVIFSVLSEIFILQSSTQPPTNAEKRSSSSKRGSVAVFFVFGGGWGGYCLGGFNSCEIYFRQMGSCQWGWK